MIAYADAIRLKCALRLTPVELAILVTVLDAEGQASRRTMFEAAAAAGPNGKSRSEHSFRVLLCNLNGKLPDDIKVLSAFPNGKRGLQGVAGTHKACAFELSGDRARERLMKLPAKAPTMECAA